MKRLTPLLPLVLLIAIFAVGCGGDDDSTDTGTTGSANADKEYLVETDQFCGEANSQLQKKAAGAFPDGNPSKKQATAFVKSDIAFHGVEPVTEPDVRRWLLLYDIKASPAPTTA